MHQSLILRAPTSRFCVVCHNDIPAERQPKGFSAKGFITCGDACAKIHRAATHSSRIRARNAAMTKILAGLKFASQRDEYLQNAMRIFALYRIGAFRHDKACLKDLRREAEALMNTHLFASAPSSNIHKCLIAYARKTYEGADVGLFNHDWLFKLASEQGWIDSGFDAVNLDLHVFTDGPKKTASVIDNPNRSMDFDPANDEAPAPVQAVSAPAPEAIKEAVIENIEAEATETDLSKPEPDQLSRKEIYQGIVSWVKANNKAHKPEDALKVRAGVIFNTIYGQFPPTDFKFESGPCPEWLNAQIKNDNRNFAAIKEQFEMSGDFDLATKVNASIMEVFPSMARYEVTVLSAFALSTLKPANPFYVLTAMKRLGLADDSTEISTVASTLAKMTGKTLEEDTAFEEGQGYVRPVPAVKRTLNIIKGIIQAEKTAVRVAA